MEKRAKLPIVCVGQREDDFFKIGTGLINQLPDALLVEILSLLPMNQAVQMSVLARRWKHLWKYVHSVLFNWTEIKYGIPDDLHATGLTYQKQRLYCLDRAACAIETFLHHNQASKIRKLNVVFPANQDNAERVDSWIQFALSHGAEELMLNLTHFGLLDGEFYKIPSCVFHSQCLTVLRLIGGEVDMPSSVSLPLLKTFFLKDLIRSAAAARFIISKCPSLESLTLLNCFDSCFNSERLVISSGSLHFRSLKVEHRNEIVIDASALQLLELRLGHPWNCLLRNLSSSIRVYLNLRLESSYSSASSGYMLMRMLDHLHHARSIKLSDDCIQALSKTRNSKRILARCLELEMLSLKTSANLRRITTVLSFFPAVDTLIIFFKEFFLQGEEGPLTRHKCWKSLRISFSELMHHIKTLEVHDFISYESVSRKRTLDEMWQKCEVKIELVSIVLEYSKCLEKVDIILRREQKFSEWEGKSQFKLKLTEKLQNIKRASPAAKIYVA